MMKVSKRQSSRRKKNAHHIMQVNVNVFGPQQNARKAFFWAAQAAKAVLRSSPRPTGAPRTPLLFFIFCALFTPPPHPRRLHTHTTYACTIISLAPCSPALYLTTMARMMMSTPPPRLRLKFLSKIYGENVKERPNVTGGDY